jgi:transposase
MRKIMEILRLKWDAGLSNRQIAASCSISHSTVKEVLIRAEEAGLTWPLPNGLDEESLEAKLYPQPATTKSAAGKRPQPDFAYIHKELSRAGVTLQLLWEEYKEKYPDGYQRSQYCELYRRWQKTLDLSMRQIHRAGEKLFVDYAGQTVPVTDLSTGEVREAQIFVAVLGASNYTYVEATFSQDLVSWINAHINAFKFFGGVTEIIVPDNLKSGVYQANRYEPDINLSYLEMAQYYGTVIIPARVRKPKDKAKVEKGVQHSQNRILAALRNHHFFSLAELNDALQEYQYKLNTKPFQKLEGSRYELYQAIDKPALKSLPATPYEFAEWKNARVNIDYHIEFGTNYYSVPYQLVHKEVNIRATAAVVEVLYKGKRVASHARSYKKRYHSTLDTHMPASHRAHAEWTPSRIINWAKEHGPNISELVQTIMKTKAHPEQGYRSCLGIIRLEKQYPVERLEAAAKRALVSHAYSYKSIKSILENGLDSVPLEKPAETTPITHANLRGSSYYSEEGVIN